MNNYEVFTGPRRWENLDRFVALCAEHGIDINIDGYHVQNGKIMVWYKKHKRESELKS